VLALPVHLSRRALVFALASVGALASALMLPDTLAPRLEKGFDALGGAQPFWLWLGCAFFVASLLCSAAAWRVGIGECGGEIGWCRTAASYGAGSLTNSLLPGRVGDGVRIALFSRAFERRSAAWTSSGLFLLLGAARALALVALTGIAAAIGVIPLWPVLVLAGAVSLAATIALAVRRRQPASRLSHLLDAFRAFGRSPAASLRVSGWALGSIVTRLAAASAIASALGVAAPLLAALVIAPALEIAGLLPLTPGNLGVTSGAIAIALRAHGIDLTSALSVGIAVHAVEMAAGLGFGTASLLYLCGTRSPQARRITSVLAGCALLGLAAAFVATLALT
jgi:uncharacterized membrane protein YbhN (UPF0104 family)